MATKKLNEDFMAKVLEDTVWQELSRDFKWNEALLEKSKDKVSWKDISYNSNILWTSSMLEKFKDLIDWHELSKTLAENNFSKDDIEKFKDNWNWSELSSNSDLSFSLEFIDQHLEKWNWNDLINNYALETLYNENFLDKYNPYIPASTLQNSRLWYKLVEIKKEKVKNNILSS